MKSLIYDTETTGLPDWNKPSDDPSQPRVTQLCAELVDDDSGEVLAAMHTLIKPDGWTIPPDLEALTGITTAKCSAFGIPMTWALAVFMQMHERADHRVAHNESFDMRMLRIELFRDGASEGDADEWKKGKAFCTCEQSKRIVNLPPTTKMVAKGMTTPKPPNLGEAYQHFTGQKLEGAHNAAIDVMACKAVYFALRSLQRKVA
jgi:DNA polymerase-3 subunit epsilon